LEQTALEAPGIDQAVRRDLSEARARFERPLPGITHMRDALVHIDEWSRGTGLGPQRKARAAGPALRDVARDYWGFAYVPGAGTVSLGPFSIEVDAVDNAVRDLYQSIWLAARKVVGMNIAELRARSITALARAGSPASRPQAS
jgi:hypothetical protein